MLRVERPQWVDGCHSSFGSKADIKVVKERAG